MAFTQSSRPIQHQDTWVDPISQDLLLKGAIFTNDNIEKNSKEASSVLDMLHNIPSLPGADTEKKNEIMNNVMKQASQLSYHDLRSPSAVNQLKSYVSQVASSPDIQGIAERAYKYKNDLDEYNSFLQKGKPVSEWRQKSLKDAQNYIASNTYLRDKRFNGEIVEDPDLDKWKNTIIDNVGEDEKVYKDPSNPSMWITEKGKSPEKLASALLQGIYTNPQVKNYYDDLFESQHDDVSWEDVADKQYQSHFNNLQTILSSPSTTPLQKQEAQKELNILNAAYNSPSKASFFKNDYKNNWLQEQVQNDAHAYSTLQKTPKYDDLAKYSIEKDIDLAHKQKELEYKEKYTESKLASIKDGIIKNLYEDARKSGMTVIDDQGQLIPVEQIQADPRYQAIFKKSDDNDDIIGFGGVTKKPKAWKKSIQEGNKDDLVKILNTLDPNEQVDDKDNIKVEGNKITYTVGKNEKRSYTLDELYKYSGLDNVDKPKKIVL